MSNSRYSKWREIKFRKDDTGTAHEKAKLLVKFKTTQDQTRGIPVTVHANKGHGPWSRPGMLRISNMDNTPEIHCEKPWVEKDTDVPDTSIQWTYGMVNSAGTIIGETGLTWEYADY